MRVARVGLLVGCLFGSFDLALAQLQQDARSALLGTWKVTRLVHDGEEQARIVGMLEMQFSDSEIRLVQQGRDTISVTYSMDESNPGRFSWSTSRNDYVREQRGRYSLDGDTLTICLSSVGSPRATDLTSRPGDGRTVFVLKQTSSAAELTDVPIAEPRVMQLGVFVLSREETSPVRQMIRLFVDHEGEVFGATYDLETRQRQSLRGRIDRDAQTATWRAGDVVMTVPLAGLTQDASSVTVQRDGHTEQWVISFAFLPMNIDAMNR